MPTLNDLFTGIRGYGDAATAGLIKVPQAALMAGMSNDPKYTFRKALEDLREDNRQLSQSGYWLTGQLVGGAALGAATGGAGALANTGRQAAMGAIQAYSDTGDAKDALLGGTIGGVIGGAGQGVRYLATKGANKQMDSLTKAAVERNSKRPVYTELVPSESGGVVTKQVPKPTAQQIKDNAVEAYQLEPGGMIRRVAGNAVDKTKSIYNNLGWEDVADAGVSLGAGALAAQTNDQFPWLTGAGATGLSLLALKKKAAANAARAAATSGSLHVLANPNAMARGSSAATQAIIPFAQQSGRPEQTLNYDGDEVLDFGSAAVQQKNSGEDILEFK